MSAAVLTIGATTNAQQVKPVSQWRSRFAAMKSAVAKPIQRVTQQRVFRPTAKPVVNQPPATNTAAPHPQYHQYHRPTRRLADLPMGRRGGYSKPWTRSQDESRSFDKDIEDFGLSDDGPDLEDPDDDDLDLESDDDERSDDDDSDEEDSLATLDLEARDIREIRPNINYALQGIRNKELPPKLSTSRNDTYVRPERTPIEFHWMASNLHHYPLYFEDPALERYGHSYHPLIQPFASAGRMTTQLLGLPYQMAIDPIHRRRYSLGWIRPGDCAPKLKYRLPLNKKAALVEAAAITAGAVILP